MVKKRKRNLKGVISFLAKSIFFLIKFILKIPFYIIKFFYELKKRGEKKARSLRKKRKRADIKTRYEKFGLIKKISGDFGRWERNLIEKDSLIGIVVGARGSGKSAFGIKLLENIHTKKSGKNFYAIGFREDELPFWINVADSVEKIKNNSFVLIDEGGVLFSSRKSMSSANKILSDLVLVSRHKNISIIFISQNSSNLDVNILRQADFLILKPSSLLQKDFERKIVRNLYSEHEGEFNKFKKEKGIFYLHSDEFRGFLSNPLPSFWSEKLSKSWREK